MRILITGGMGFVGGRLAAYLLQAGHHVVIGSRQADSPPDWLPQAEVVQIRWDDSSALEQSCKGVDLLIQAAGMNAQDCAADPVAALEFNGLATARLLAAAIRAGVPRFIYLSTAHVYASPLAGTITEDTCPRNLHPYATSHLAGENAVLYAAKIGIIESIVLRLSNVVGAPMHKDVNCWTLLTNDLCKQAGQKKQLILHRNAGQHRDFIAMSEVCRAINWLLSGDFINSNGDIFNIGSAKTISLMDMAKLIQGRSEINFGHRPEINCSTNNDAKRDFLFSNKKITSRGLDIGSDLISEIDRLVLFCERKF